MSENSLLGIPMSDAMAKDVKSGGVQASFTVGSLVVILQLMGGFPVIGASSGEEIGAVKAEIVAVKSEIDAFRTEANKSYDQVDDMHFWHNDIDPLTGFMRWKNSPEAQANLKANTKSVTALVTKLDAIIEILRQRPLVCEEDDIGERLAMVLADGGG